MSNLEAIINANGGYVTRAQLLDLSFSDQTIHNAVKRKLLVRIRHGTYAIEPTWKALSPEQQHVVLTRSVLDKLGPDVVASHHSAAALLGLDLYGVDLTMVHITRLDGRPGRREAGVAHHHGLIVPNSDLVEVDGRMVTEPMRAVFESSSLSSTESGMVVASSALRRKAFTKDELEEAGKRFNHWQGTRRARLAIRLADGRLETVGEVRSLHMFWCNGIPYPELQWVVVNRDGVEIARTDFAWIAFRHTGEFDGLVKYGRLNPYATDPGRVLADEKVREDLVRDEDLGMSRWVWADLAPKVQEKTADKILAGMERSKRLYLRNATHIALS